MLNNSLRTKKNYLSSLRTSPSGRGQRTLNPQGASPIVDSNSTVRTKFLSVGNALIGPKAFNAPWLRAARLLSILLTFAGGFASIAHAADALPSDGVRFTCEPRQLAQVEAGMTTYLNELGISESLFQKVVSGEGRVLSYVLRTPAHDTDTLTLRFRPEFGISDARIRLPSKSGHPREVVTVSEKEIVLALFQHGRLTNFSNNACDINVFRDHVGIRQNTVAWAEELNWDWPDGGPAKWNNKYWNRGTPVARYPLPVVVNDAFLQQKKYGIGCYTATKLVMLQGALDYYHRVKKDPTKVKLIEERALSDKEPLVNVEPGKMWSFEKDFSPTELTRPGKLLKLQEGVAPKNFIPGDWLYFLNTDPVTYEKTGYEGSNAIYLGRNRFDDYYNDHHHSYSYRQKLNEVYQWRNKVFSRTRDADKVVPLSDADFERLSETPAKGGLLMDFRVSHYLFGAENLPVLLTQ